MDGEECRYRQASPREPSSALKEQKQQHCVDGVQQYARVVVSSGIEVEKLIIHRMREPGKRMPIRLRVCSKRPADRFPGQACAEMLVLSNVAIIIEVDKVMIERLAEHDPDEGGQQNANREFNSAIGGLTCLLRKLRHFRPAAERVPTGRNGIEAPFPDNQVRSARCDEN